jgi:hypothetical protein
VRAARIPKTRRSAAAAATLGLVLCTALALTLGTAEAKKKKGKTASVFQQTVQVNGGIPNDAASGPSTPLNSTLTLGKKFKRKVVGDLNVTGITTTGSGNGAASDLGFRLIAPNGRSVRLINASGLSGQSIGPLTLDDDTTQEICNAVTPPCNYPVATLNRPFAGTANLQYLGTAGTGPLAKFNGLPMRGTWTFQVWDDAGPTTSTLNSWGLQITAARPVS